MERLSIVSVVGFGIVFGVATGCTSSSTSRHRAPAQEEGTFEKACSEPMEQGWSKLQLASIYHRDTPTPALYDMTIQVRTKGKDGSITSHVLPTPMEKSPVKAVPGLGIFPEENGRPYVEYSVDTEVNWKPKNARYVSFKIKEDWKRTDRAGVCFYGIGRLVPLTVRFADDLAANQVKLLLGAKVAYVLLGKRVEYVADFQKTPGTNAVETEIILPEGGIDLEVVLTYLREGMKRTEPRHHRIHGSSTGEMVEFVAADLK